MFWLIIGFTFAVVLLLARRADRRGTGRDKRISPPSKDPAVGEAKAMRGLRNLGASGPGGGP